MKKHLSVLFLAARSTLLPVVGVLTLMAAAEALAFFLVLRTGAARPLAEVWGKSRIPLIAALGLCAVCFLLAGVGSRSTQGNTLCRLRVRERTVTLWWWLNAALCLVLLWAVQVGLAFLLSSWYAATADPAVVNPQTVFLTFYQIPFLHGLFPLAEGNLWARNGFLLAALSLCAAKTPSLLRRGRKPFALISLVTLTIVLFPAEMGRSNTSILLCMVYFFVLFYSFWQIFAKEEVEI